MGGHQGYIHAPLPPSSKQSAVYLIFDNIWRATPVPPFWNNLVYLCWTTLFPCFHQRTSILCSSTLYSRSLLILGKLLPWKLKILSITLLQTDFPMLGIVWNVKWECQVIITLTASQQSREEVEGGKDNLRAVRHLQSQNSLSLITRQIITHSQETRDPVVASLFVFCQGISIYIDNNYVRGSHVML